MEHTLGRIDAGLQVALRWISARPAIASILLIAICLGLYLPGIASLPVTDRDEARFAQATKQMVESGDFIDIRFQDDPRYKKPIGIYWLQSLSVSAFSPDELTQIWAYRLPSLIGIIAGVLLLWWAMRPLYGRQTALLAAILLAGAFTLALEARIAKSDGALFAFTVLAQAALARLYLLRRQPPRVLRPLATLFWAALGFGILIKGPIAPGLALLTILPLIIFDRDRSWLKNLHALWGLPLMLAITLPWFIAIGVVSDWEFYRLALGEDFVAKLQSGQEKHWGPPGFYFILFWWSFWPGALVTTGGAALWLWRHRISRRALFLLSWIIPYWLVLEATPTKLPHYAMVLYPAIAVAAAWVLREAVLIREVRRRTYKQAAAIWLFVAALQVAFLAFLLIYFGIFPAFWVYPLALGVVGLAFIVVRAAWGGRFFTAIGASLLTAGLLYTAAFRFILPSVEPIWISQQIAEVVETLRPCMGGPVVLTRYYEPSAVFLMGTATRRMSVEDANAALSRGDTALALMRREEAEQLPLVDPAPRAVACIDGFNVNGGDELHLQLMTAKPETELAVCSVPQRFRCTR